MGQGQLACPDIRTTAAALDELAAMPRAIWRGVLRTPKQMRMHFQFETAELYLALLTPMVAVDLGLCQRLFPCVS